jgi:hypothetical protein
MSGDGEGEGTNSRHAFNGYEFDDALTCKGASVPGVWACGVARDWLSLTHLHIQHTLGHSRRFHADAKHCIHLHTSPDTSA